MATKKFPSELSSRGTVKITDKLIIHNIDTGATEYTTVADLLAALSITDPIGGMSISGNILFDYPLSSSDYADIRARYLGQDNCKSAIRFSNPLNEYSGDISFWTQPNTAGAAMVERVRISNNGIAVAGLSEYNDNAAAVAAGLTAGAFYRTGDVLKICH